MMAMTTEIDIERARAETPGVEHVLHFNNAGAALTSTPVIEAVRAHLDLEVRIGGYEAMQAAEPKVRRTYAAAAALLNCDASEIAVMENATMAWAQVFYGLAREFKPGDRILTAEAEYISNYIAYLQMAKRTGCVIDVIPSDETGALSVAALEEMIDDRVKLISLSHVPTNGGLVNPAAAVGRIARAAGVPYLLDACQSAGQMPLDVDRIGCDFLSFTGRKYLRGPRGTGILYARSDALQGFEPAILDLHGAQWLAADRYQVNPDASRFENWEFNYAAVIGLGQAVDYALEWGLTPIQARVDALARRLRNGLAALKGVTVTDLGPKPCGIVTFTKDGRACASIKDRLARQAINVSVSRQSSTRLDMEKRGLTEVVRASVHYYNAEEEVDRFLEAIDQL